MTISEITQGKVERARVTCSGCGWRGIVRNAIYDVDGRGNLGCPRCMRTIRAIVIKPRRVGPSEIK